MQIDFVSDIACPWCAIGWNALERAAERVPHVKFTLRAQPFELNPSMPKEGADTGEYLTKKYGMKPEQLAQSQAMLKSRGAEVGFAFGDRGRIWNTFDAHRLIHWSGLDGKQRELVQALFRAYHGEGKNVSDHAILADVAQRAGLDGVTAKAVLADGRYADEVRGAIDTWRDAGISAVPSVVINETHLIQGGQPASVFERALRELADPA